MSFCSSGVNNACGQGDWLICQDVLLSTMEQVAIRVLVPLPKHIESPML